MGLSTDEQETVIVMGRNDKHATVYTSDSRMLAKLQKKGEPYKRVKVDKQDGKIIAATYEVDKKLISFRNKRIKRILSDEQKQAARERMASLWAARGKGE